MYKKEIDKNFIDYLRLNLSTTNWIFDKAEKKEIVPKELTHDYLLRNFNIDESIYKYYHLPTCKFLSDNEFQELKDIGFIGQKETALRPYSNIIYGAYYSRSDIKMKLAGLVYSKRDYTIEGKEIKYFADLIPYFKEYAKGFENGFNEFDNSQIKPFLTMLAEKQDYVNKVFEFVTKQIFFSHSWATLQTGFTTNQNNEIIQAFENGQKQGYFYRAWSVIFSNHKFFAPLFQEHLKALPPQQNETKTPTAPAIALFCNLINEAEIIKKESDEIPETYCKRICENYKLKYTDRVRQNFNGNKSKKHYKELTELILPCIDVTIKDKIQKYLDSKNPPKQKLYA